MTNKEREGEFGENTEIRLIFKGIKAKKKNAIIVVVIIANLMQYFVSFERIMACFVIWVGARWWVVTDVNFEESE